jgi:hypothetical protein
MLLLTNMGLLLPLLPPLLPPLPPPLPLLPSC